MRRYLSVGIILVAGWCFGVPIASAGTDDQLWAWGLGTQGQLGNGAMGTSGTPVPVSGLTNPLSIAAGAGEGFALMPDGAIEAWGDNSVGELGDGSDARQRLTPVKVADISTATAIAAGDDFGVAVLSDGTVDDWGDGSHGNLGNGTDTYTNVPVQASLSGTAIAAAAGWAHVLALRDDGSIEAWGYNDDGQLGNGSKTDSDVPVKVTGISTATAVAAGYFSSYGLLANGTIDAWGSDMVSSSDVPVRVPGISAATAIAAGGSHALALLADGTVEAWGDNMFGQLGNGTTNSSSTPVPVTDLTDVVAIAASWGTSYALRSNGTVWAWGYGDFALGTGSYEGDTSTPVQVADLGIGADAIASSGTAQIALAVAHPVAEFGPTSLTFGTQPQYTLGSPQGVTLTDIGAPGLEETYTTTTGANPDDFLKSSDSCVGQALADAASCQLDLRFAPSATPGTVESATFLVATNAPGAPLQAAVSGIAGAPSQGPPGQIGATGKQGPRGPAGKIELVTCRAVTTHHRRTVQKCTTKLASGTFTFMTGNLARATISRHGNVYATGTRVATTSGVSELVLAVLRPLRHGRYTLTIRGHRDGRRIVQRSSISIT